MAPGLQNPSGWFYFIGPQCVPQLPSSPLFIIWTIANDHYGQHRMWNCYDGKSTSWVHIFLSDTLIVASRHCIFWPCCFADKCYHRVVSIYSAVRVSSDVTTLIKSYISQPTTCSSWWLTLWKWETGMFQGPCWTCVQVALSQPLWFSRPADYNRNPCSSHRLPECPAAMVTNTER